MNRTKTTEQVPRRQKKIPSCRLGRLYDPSGTRMWCDKSVYETLTAARVRGSLIVLGLSQMSSCQV